MITINYIRNTIKCLMLRPLGISSKEMPGSKHRVGMGGWGNGGGGVSGGGVGVRPGKGKVENKEGLYLGSRMRFYSAWCRHPRRSALKVT